MPPAIRPLEYVHRLGDPPDRTKKPYLDKKGEVIPPEEIKPHPFEVKVDSEDCEICGHGRNNTIHVVSASSP